MISPNVKRKSLLIFFALLFSLPSIMAYYAYYKLDRNTFAKTNKGELLTPVLSLNDLGISPNLLNEKKWKVLLISTGQRQKDLNMIGAMRHHLLLLGKEMSRTEEVMLVSLKRRNKLRDALDRNDLSDIKLISSAKALEKAKFGKLHFAYIIDPNGNVVLRYKEKKAFDNIFSDLKHLIKVSHIG